MTGSVGGGGEEGGGGGMRGVERRFGRPRRGMGAAVEVEVVVEGGGTRRLVVVAAVGEEGRSLRKGVDSKATSKQRAWRMKRKIERVWRCKGEVGVAGTREGRTCELELANERKEVGGRDGELTLSDKVQEDAFHLLLCSNRPEHDDVEGCDDEVGKEEGGHRP